MKNKNCENFIYYFFLLVFMTAVSTFSTLCLQNEVVHSITYNR